MNVYSYDGPVMEFDVCVHRRWQSQTKAVSEGKAKSNLAYQWKTKYNRAPNAKISLPGKLVIKQ